MTLLSTRCGSRVRATIADPLLALLAPRGSERRAAVEGARDHGAPGRYALRAAALGDSRADVRSAAVLALGAAGDPAMAVYLRDALGDPSHTVRRAAYHALARLGDRATLPLAQRALDEEPSWSVRRAAVHALGAIGKRAVTSALERALRDPFWRVRHAALQVLDGFGRADGHARAGVLDSREVRHRGFEDDEDGGAAENAARRYLASRWQETQEPVVEPGSETRLPPDDPDPAVVTARLVAMRAGEPAVDTLVRWLGDPHEPLREAAVRHLAARDDLAGLERALDWLVDPRVPYGPTAVMRLCDEAPGAAARLAEHLLHEPVGAPLAEGLATRLAWALTHAPDPLSSLGLVRACALLGHDHVPLRRAAVSVLRGAPDALDALTAALHDDDEVVRWLAATALAVRSPASLAPMRFGAQSPRARALLVDAAAAVLDRARLEEGATDAHAAVRAAALQALAARGELGETRRREAAADPDPWIRLAVLDEEGAAAAVRDDPDPALRRAAFERLCTTDERRAARIAIGCSDPWLRARATARLDAASGGDDLRRLLSLARDRSPAVRAAAASALEAGDPAGERVRALLAEPEGADGSERLLRAAAWVHLAHAAGEAALPLVSAQLAASRDEQERRELAILREALGGAPAPCVEHGARELAIDGLLPSRSIETPRSAQPVAARTGCDRAPVARRLLGATGLAVAPLGISGAYELTSSSLVAAREAGANLFFWEPRYQRLTGFLRASRRWRDDLVIVAGTYHADAAAIRRDVQTALRRLRTDRIDVFLLFWARSAARLSAEAFDTLAELRHRGLVRAAGFSTHHRDLALTAITRHAWDVIMVRHSAAHPGAETALFPVARERAVGLITFSNLCYGRLLVASEGEPDPRAADCYRYSLSQPGVVACISAPRRHRELVDNLAVLGDPSLAPSRIESLRRHGRGVHAESSRWNALVRRAEAQLPAAFPSRGYRDEELFLVSSGAGTP